MDLTIAIPTFRNFNQLLQTVVSLTRYVEYPYKIVIVNNGPEKGFEEALHQHVFYPNLKVIHAGENLGWQKAINLAFEQECETPLFAMANDDLSFLPYDRAVIRHLCSYFRHDNVGAVGPSSNYVMGPQNIGDVSSPCVFTTTLLIGFFMIVRSETFSAVGGLDPGLPGGDDLDLSILIRDRGEFLVVDKSCYVHHYGSQTGAKLHPYWNSPEHQELTNNVLIGKHGVRKWYETINPQASPWGGIAKDNEGDLIRTWIEGDGVELGCGATKTLPGAIGVDLNEVGQAGGVKGTRSIADIIGDVSDLPFEDESKDYLCARHIFEHLLDPIPALKEWERVLKPDGVLAIACPNQEVCQSIILDSTHLHAYTPDSLESLLEEFGFNVEETQRVGYSFLMKVRKVPVGVPA